MKKDIIFSRFEKKSPIKFVNYSQVNESRHSIDQNNILDKFKLNKEYSFEEFLINAIKSYLEDISWCEVILIEFLYKKERLETITNN